MDSAEEVVWKDSFFKDSFNVDNCLSTYTVKSDLETLRKDLKKYGNELHQQMGDILKTETEAIVNLAEYLTNLNSKVDDLSLPLNQLREEIKILYDLIRNAQESYYNKLANIKANGSRQNYLQLKLGIITSMLYIENMIKSNDEDVFNDSIVLERAVNKYSFESNYMETCGLNFDLQEISFMRKQLTKMVNKIFLLSIKTKDETVLLRCLRMYDNLGEQGEAENLYQNEIIQPLLKNLFTENYLETCNQDVNKVYSQTLEVADSHLIILTNILEKSSELKSFNFVLNSFWPEVYKLSCEGLPNLTAPGNPELFQKRFKSTWHFLQQMAVKCGDSNLIHTNATFKQYIRRFNLPVYFEIRFQQIAGKFEAEAIKKPTGEYLDSNGINCTLRITLTLWEMLNWSFNKEVFIENLADQFLKLSLLLLSRYLKWFEVALEEWQSFPQTDKNMWEIFAINAIRDLNIAKSFLKDVYSNMPEKVQPVVATVCDHGSKLISNMIVKYENNLIDIKSNEAFTFLQNVAAIPRLYRRTNRSAPKSPSNYMIDAVSPILGFYHRFKEATSEIQTIFDAVVLKNTWQYQSLVEEVLSSVCKTEETLRRLKNRNTQVSENVSEDAESAGTVSDEMKIREQIRLDVQYFYDKLYPVATHESKRVMDELKRQTS